MKFRSLMTAICVLATASVATAAPYAYIANQGTKNVRIIDTATTAFQGDVDLVYNSNNPYPFSVTVGASGQYVYVALQDVNQIAVIDTYSKTVVKRISLGTDSPGGLAVNSAETRLYVASNLSNTLIIIDIAAGNAIEVGRVTVHGSAVSNPVGVVISKDGNTAYVANSGTGTVAEVALDEANNIYSLTKQIALGANTKPMGMALNNAGTKLYVAGALGTASSILTATDAVTSLTVGLGNMSVAVTPDDTMIYAPSNSTDTLYVINEGATDTVSATTYPIIGGPLSSAVTTTPAGVKLFLTTNSGTQKLLNKIEIATNTVETSVNLPTGGTPVAIGNFIGPAFPFTITSSNGAGCTISPLGAIPVNSNGWTFSIAGTCDVKIDGVSVGSPAVYSVKNVTKNMTIDASVAPASFTLSGDWISSYGGWLVSTPAGINKTTKSAQFATGQSVTLSVGDSVNHTILPGSWTGDCLGSATTCTLVMNSAKTFGATIIQKPSGTGPIYNATKSSYHQTIAEATGAATTGDIIKVSTLITTGGTTTGTAGVKVTLSGAWSSDFGAQTTPVAMGKLTITDVAVIADKLTL